MQRHDGVWGSDQGNGTWNGQIGSLMKGEVDFIGGCMTMRPDRAKVVDYVIPVSEAFDGVFIRVRTYVCSVCST